MTREEAVRIINDRIRSAEYVESDYADCVDIEALRIAIEALNCLEIPNNSDIISRRAAIDVVSKACQEWRGIFGRCEDGLLALPSAQLNGIPIDWIEKHLEWLDNCDNDFAQLAKVGIRAMVELWKKSRI